jgi:EAL domain-containing protein (putative c-di-GMP-specific phosphodiesterase class I)
MKEVALPISESQASQLNQLTDEEAKVYTSDPASFLVACMVLDRLRNSVSELKALVCAKKPELENSFAKVISSMETLGLIRIFGDQLIVLKAAHYADYDKRTDWAFLPKIASNICRRILKLSKADRLTNGELLRWYHLPKNPMINAKLTEIHHRYMAEMENLIAWADAHPEYSGDKVQLSMLMVSDLDPEDF